MPTHSTMLLLRRGRHPSLPLVLFLTVIALSTFQNIYVFYKPLSSSSSSLADKGHHAGAGTNKNDDSPLLRRSTRNVNSNSSFPIDNGTIYAPHPPRIALGIVSSISSSGLTRRHVMRNTFLAFDSVHRTATPNRVCSLEVFSTRQVEDWGPHECQLVYTFLLGAGNQTRTKEDIPSQWPPTLLGTGVVVPASLDFQERCRKETHSNQTDLLLLNADEGHFPHVVWSWHLYVLSSLWKSAFDYVAHSGEGTFLGPVEFWQNEILSPPGSSSSNSRSRRQMIYATHSIKSKEKFTLLSIDLVEKLVAGSAPEKSYMTRDVLFNALTTTTNVTSVKLKGVHYHSTTDFEFLKAWDKYKDKLILTEGGYQDPVEIALVEASVAIKYFKDDTQKFSGPRILMGIFTTDSETEKERRAAIRSTYLSYYKESSDTPFRICSLFDLLKGSLPEKGADCQMAYAFVMGSNPNGPTELTEPNSSFPLTIVGDSAARSSSFSLLKDEDDIVHLNICENMENGKSPTWFKYATMVTDSHVYFDYVGKTDTDTLIYPSTFLENVLSKRCPPFPRNVRVYSGEFRSQNEHLPLMIGPAYCAGELYWMSSDLGRFVSSSDLDRKAVDCGVEDRAMGNFIHSHPSPIHRRILPAGKNFHEHPLKNVYEYRQEWTKWVQKQKANTT